MASVLVGDERVDLNAQLEAARRVVESHFLAAGEILTKSVDGIETLVKALEKLVSALDAKSVAATTGDMHLAAKALLNLGDHHQFRQQTITQLGRHRENIAKHVTDMRQSLSYMRAFTVNIKIVSSGIAQAGSAFESFAQEISDCIETGREELGKVEIDIIALQNDLTDAFAQGTRLSSRIGTMLPGLHKELSESADHMSGHYTRVSAVAGEVAGIARDIQKRVVRILSALQIGDITRQRIEHVQSGIVSLENANEDERVTSLCYAVLGAQLSAAIEDFNREVSEIEKSMADMAAQSRNLLKLRDMAYSGSGGKAEGFLNQLGDRISQALALVNAIEGADNSALKTGQATAAAAQHLGKRITAIQSLKNDVQYMALNTTIKCSQIGEAARPLSVIAVELRDHGRHLETAAADGLSALDELTTAAHTLAGSEAEHTGTTATDALDVAAKLIGDARQRTEKEIDVLVAEGEGVLGVLDQSSARLGFRAEIGDALEGVAAELMVLGTAAPRNANGIEKPLEGLLNAFHSHYTMAQERKVHQNFVESLGLSVTPDVRAPAGRAA